METGTIAEKVHTGRPKTKENTLSIFLKLSPKARKNLFTQKKHGLPHKYTKSRRAKAESY